MREMRCMGDRVNVGAYHDVYQRANRIRIGIRGAISRIAKSR